MLVLHSGSRYRAAGTVTSNGGGLSWSVHRPIWVFGVCLVERPFDGVAENRDRVVMFLFRLVNTRRTHVECIVRGMDLDYHSFVFVQLSCNLDKQSVNVDGLFFAHDHTSVEGGWLGFMSMIRNTPYQPPRQRFVIGVRRGRGSWWDGSG